MYLAQVDHVFAKGISLQVSKTMLPMYLAQGLGVQY